jgi:uncharacterized protein
MFSKIKDLTEDSFKSGDESSNSFIKKENELNCLICYHAPTHSNGNLTLNHLPDPIWLLAYILLGIVVGFSAGLFGIGGGGIMVPVLTVLFVLQGLAPEHTVHMALATSMAAIVLTSLSSLRAHHRQQGVLWPVVWRIAPGILLGTFSIAWVAALIPSLWLALFFAIFMLYVSARMFLDIRPKPGRTLPGTIGLSATGLGIGGISALVAIGGGSLTVPFLTWCNVDIRQAIGTSAAVGFPISVAGSLGYITGGISITEQIPFTIGFIYIPAFLSITLASVLLAPMGARLAHKLPVDTLKKLFALLLLVLCFTMIWSLIRSS